MLPLHLPLPLSTEMTMQSLMKEASSYLDSGRLKISYELYIEALLSAIKELGQLEFIDQCVVVENSDLSSVFRLAQTCLKQAETISLKTTKRPPVPPKPYNLKIAPPLPMRPVNMTRAKSKPEFVKKPCNYTTNDVHTDMDDDEDEDEEDDYTEYDSSDEEEDDDEEEEVIVNTKLKASQQKRKASAPSLKLLKSSSNRPKLPRRSSTSNLSSTSAPSSPLSSVSIPINAVKSFLSLPGSMASHTTNRTGMYSVVAGDSEGSASTGDDIFLLTNSTIDPNVLITVQTSNSDSLSTPTGSSSNYLPMIPQAPLVTVYQSLQKQLEDALEMKKQGGQNAGSANQQVLDIQSLLNRVRNIHMSATTVPTVLQFQPVLIAYQLTLIDSIIFRNIPVEAILSHAPKTPHPSIVASTDFFNYLTRLIEHAILLQQDASGRAQHINHWIKVAGKCHELKNYQTLKAVISALGTPPIQRLKRSWQFIPKKSMHLLEDLSDFMSEASNYDKYRQRLGLTQSSNEENDDSVASSSLTTPSKKSSTRKNSFNEPTVPFLGIFIHDMTYLLAAISKKKKQQQQQRHNSDWKLEATNTASDAIHQDLRVSELLRLFKNLQRSPPYSPNLSASCIKDLNKNRKRKLSHALSRNAAIKRPSAYYHDDAGELSIELQQCLVTQYLLTRSWVSEKTVDELSLVREPTKRSFSVVDSLSTQQNQQLPPAPPPLTSSVSLTTATDQQQQQQQQQGGILRSSSGSFTSGGSNSSNSRPISLEDDQQEAEILDKKNTGFWLFGRKSADQGYLKEASTYGTMQRSPRHFSFEDLNRKQHATIPSISPQENSTSSTFRMNREGSQSSLASAIFRKDFWKGGNQQQQQQPKGPLMSFNSDPSLMQRKGSSASSVSVHLSPSTSASALPSSAVATTDASVSNTAASSSSSSNRPLNNKNLRHVLSSPHPLDLSSSNSPTTAGPAATPLSEISSFNWD
ncbi:hypothetical protein [Parasitella parasitica]|uniref:Ras-GEF domain-containing protein n=1 Tax=Parasitella parasitica TaxID=35722 RepID=A0A0B7MZQ7_9FUNG|nr:hypothetical protein [Parasitella parasitica]